MSTNIIIDSEQFHKRCKKIYEKVKMPILVLLGKREDVQEFNMNSAIFHYILGYEFSETFILIKEKPIIFTSFKKTQILSDLKNIEIIIKNKDESNVDDFISILDETIGVADKKNIKGDLPLKILQNIRIKDISKEILEIFLIKDEKEINLLKKASHVANYLINRGIDLIRDDDFSKASLENYMNDKIIGIQNEYIEFSNEPEYSSDFVRLGIRYKGYCVEIGREFMKDLSVEYQIQNFVIQIIKENKNSLEVLKEIENYLSEKGFLNNVSLFSIGLLCSELNFNENFNLFKNMVFVLSIDEKFSNTFYLNENVQFLTKEDSPEDFSVQKMKFRNKKNETELRTKIKEHQKELLDNLIEENIKKYQENNKIDVHEENKNKNLCFYASDSEIKRSTKISIDYENFYILLPILRYSVPFHISFIKNLSLSNSLEKTKLRINFKESKEIKNYINTNSFDTQIKSVTINVSSEEGQALINSINELKKDFYKPKIEFVKENVNLLENSEKTVLTDVLLKTDLKTGTKKITNNLVLHKNGFKYAEVVFLFKNIKHIFLQNGDFENLTVLHFNLKEPILVNGKITRNLQFHKKMNISYHDTGKRENERLEILKQQEEEIELEKINKEFFYFCEKIELTSGINIQILENSFIGVYHKEATNIYITTNSLVSVNESPFFVLNYDQVEVINFERVTFSTKTFDCVFVFKDKSKHPAIISAIETTKLNYIKTVFDNLNLVFMQTKVNINWNALMNTIMKNPLGFYENGGWCELLVDDEVEESTEESESSISSSESCSGESQTGDEEESEDAESEVISEQDEDTSSFVESDTEESEKRYKRRRT